jgi:hypothetical protein
MERERERAAEEDKKRRGDEGREEGRKGEEGKGE